MDAIGRHCPGGISDWEIAQRIKMLIESHSNKRIRVHITKDPFKDYISGTVRKQIAASDLMLCLFTKRTHDQVTDGWIPSVYTATEAAAFLTQFPFADQAHNRLFGLVEDGVDRNQLGLAFHGDRTSTGFNRGDLNQLDDNIRRIVDSVIERNERPRISMECRSQDKTMIICRDGRVKVEVRYRYHFNKPETRPAMMHSLWRISQPLPEIKVLLDTAPGQRSGMLRAVPLNCGLSGQPQCGLRIKPLLSKGAGNERRFQVEATGIEFQSGEELYYALAWEYPNAFCRPEFKQNEYPNSVGMRCGDRGVIDRASLTIMFERDLECDEPHRLLQEAPKVFLSTSTSLPADQDHEEFWHRATSWRFEKQLKSCPKLSGAHYDVYRWRAEHFSGMVKVTFDPHENYFQLEPLRDSFEVRDGKF